MASKKGNILDRLEIIKESMKPALTTEEGNELERFVQKIKTDREEYIANGHDSRVTSEGDSTMDDNFVGESAEQEIDVC